MPGTEIPHIQILGRGSVKLFIPDSPFLFFPLAFTFCSAVFYFHLIIFTAFSKFSMYLGGVEQKVDFRPVTLTTSCQGHGKMASKQKDCRGDQEWSYCVHTSYTFGWRQPKAF